MLETVFASAIGAFTFAADAAAVFDLQQVFPVLLQAAFLVQALVDFALTAVALADFVQVLPAVFDLQQAFLSLLTVVALADFVQVLPAVFDAQQAFLPPSAATVVALALVQAVFDLVQAVFDLVHVVFVTAASLAAALVAFGH